MCYEKDFFYFSNYICFDSFAGYGQRLRRTPTLQISTVLAQTTLNGDINRDFSNNLIQREMKIMFKTPQWFTVTTTLCLVIVTLFAATSCEKHENLDEDKLYIHAKVENAEKYNNIVAVKLMMRDNVIHEDVELARADWKDGGFTIGLPKIDRKKYREFVSFRMLPITVIENLTTISISNKDARSGIAVFVGVDKEDNVITSFFPFVIDENGNAATASFSYVNSDVSISGYIEAGVFGEEYDEYLSYNFTYWWRNLTIYSRECKEGWNASSYSSFESPEGIITNKSSSIPINSSLKWYGGDIWGNLD